jgi:hypothetical protein
MFAGSNPAEAIGFFRAKKSSGCLPSEGSLPHVADLRHVKEPCDYMEVGSQAKFLPSLTEVFDTCVVWSASGVDGMN